MQQTSAPLVTCTSTPQLLRRPLWMVTLACTTWTSTVDRPPRQHTLFASPWARQTRLLPQRLHWVPPWDRASLHLLPPRAVVVSMAFAAGCTQTPNLHPHPRPHPHPHPHPYSHAAQVPRASQRLVVEQLMLPSFMATGPRGVVVVRRRLLLMLLLLLLVLVLRGHMGWTSPGERWLPVVVARRDWQICATKTRYCWCVRACWWCTQTRSACEGAEKPRQHTHLTDTFACCDLCLGVCGGVTGHHQNPHPTAGSS